MIQSLYWKLCFYGNRYCQVKNVENIYVDGKDSPQFVDILGNIKAKQGQTLIACAIQVDTKETSGEINAVHNKNTEFFINMANRILMDN